MIATVEDLDRTLDRFPGLTKSELRRILVGRAGPEPEVEAGRQTGHRSLGIAREVSIWTDGASRGNPGPAAIGVVIRGAGGETIAEIGRVIGTRTNNFAEYEAVRSGLEHALELGARKVILHADSELIIRQLTGLYRVKNAALRPLYESVKALEAKLESGITYKHVPREMNKDADRLANLALDSAA